MWLLYYDRCTGPRRGHLLPFCRLQLLRAGEMPRNMLFLQLPGILDVLCVTPPVKFKPLLIQILLDAFQVFKYFLR